MVAILLLLAGANADLGAAPAATSRVVTLDEALAAADSIPEVVIARAAHRVAEAGVRTEKLPNEPTLTLETKSVTARESVALSVPFRWGGQRASAVSAAKAELDAAARSVDAARLEARRLCRAAWYTL